MVKEINLERLKSLYNISYSFLDNYIEILYTNKDHNLCIELDINSLQLGIYSNLYKDKDFTGYVENIDIALNLIEKTIKYYHIEF